jgi:hypothetical protein
MNENGEDEEIAASSVIMGDSPSDFATNASSEASALPTKTIRLVDWNTDTLCRILELGRNDGQSQERTSLSPKELDNAWIRVASKGVDIMSEVKEDIDFPKFQSLVEAMDTVTVSDEVREQLRCYILAIASKYTNNAFHNFEVRHLSAYSLHPSNEGHSNIGLQHASHVTMVRG